MTSTIDRAAGPSKSAIALLLTFVAGGVDIIGYTSIYRAFSAHVTGTTVQLGHALVGKNWSAAAIAASLVAAFLVGSVAGRAVIEVGARIHFRRVASVTLSMEALILIGVIVARTQIHAGVTISTAQVCFLLGALAWTMGLQTATLTRVGALTVHTTFVTGMVNKLAQLVSHVFFETYDLLRARGQAKEHYRRRRTRSAKHAAFMFGIWFLYLSGAAAGAFLNARCGIRALYLPVALIIVAIAVDGFRPLSIEEERDQSER